MSERALISLAQPFRSLADIPALLDSRINHEADRRVSAERIFTLDGRSVASQRSEGPIGRFARSM